MSNEEESIKLNIRSSSQISDQKTSINSINELKEENKKNEEELEINIPEIQNEEKLIYGKYYTFCYKDNEPIFAIGPDILYFILLFSLNICFNIFILYLIWENSYLIIKIFGIIISTLQLLLYLITSIINPGLPKKKYEYYANHPHKGNYKKCSQCNLWINIKKLPYHCYDCGCCVEGYDHHCPWTTKCVGRGNLYLFYIMIGFTFLLFGYFFFSIMMMTVYVSNHNK